MSWGITVKNAYIPHVAKDRIESEIEDHERTLRYIREQILVRGAFAHTIGKDCEGEELPAHEAYLMDMRSLLDEYEETASELGRLYLAQGADEVEDS